MGIFSRKYIYVEVCFLHGSRPYSYRTSDRSIKVNDVVMVPAGDETKPAIVASVRTYAEKDVPYPLNLTKEIIGKADRANRKLFKGIDMRMSLDISTKSVPTTSGHATVVTDKAERQMVRQKLSGNKSIKIVESQPVSKAGKIVSRDDKGKRNKIGHWTKQEHLFGEITYECSECGSCYSKPEVFCPHCHAEMRKTKYDPVWVEEMEYFD